MYIHTRTQGKVNELNLSTSFSTASRFKDYYDYLRENIYVYKLLQL